MNEPSKTTLHITLTGTITVDQKSLVQLLPRLEAHRITPAQNLAPVETGFINEKEILKWLPISRRTLFAWRTKGKIPSVHLGGRRVLFHWPSVEAALLRDQNG